jgi:hypothetical protein
VRAFALDDLCRPDRPGITCGVAAILGVRATQVGLERTIGRARRRFLELRGRGIAADPDQVLAEIRDRDAQDANRPVAPLKPAPDAITIDTTALDADAASAAARAAIERRLADR